MQIYWSNPEAQLSKGKIHRTPRLSRGNGLGNWQRNFYLFDSQASKKFQQKGRRHRDTRYSGTGGWEGQLILKIIQIILSFRSSTHGKIQTWKTKKLEKTKKHVVKNKRAWSFTIFLRSQSPLLHPVLPFVHHFSKETVLLNLNPVNSGPMQWLISMFFTKISRSLPQSWPRIFLL